MALGDKAKETPGNGALKLAVDQSPYKTQIDEWLNEHKSANWISEQLRELGGYISPISINKYRKVREERLQKELEKHPDFAKKQEQVNEVLNDKIGEIQVVDLMGNLATLIGDSAELLADAKERNVQINTVKDMRMIQQTMLDAIGAYGTTMLNAQKFQEIQKDPSLLNSSSTTINIQVKEALSDILKSSIKEGGDNYGLIDQLRKCIKQ